MKRKALLIGNTDGLPGVKVDLRNLTNYLQSDKGGAWLPTEIYSAEDIRRSVLLNIISQYKIDKIDYLILFFSGHGGQERNTILSLNKFKEVIQETELQYITSRQLNIYDCCRCYPEPIQAARIFEGVKLSESARDHIRLKYDHRIMEARSQQVTLYSCSPGEYSSDTANGGLYIQNFIRSASQINAGYKLVSTAHEEARVATTAQSNFKQNPDHFYPKLNSSEQLIISLIA